MGEIVSVGEIVFLAVLLVAGALAIMLFVASLMLMRKEQEAKESAAKGESDVLRAQLVAQEALRTKDENKRHKAEIERLNAALRRKGGAGDPPPGAGGVGA